MGYTVTQIECHECGAYLLDTGRFLECDECGLVEEKTNEKIIRSIKAEYPNAKITETDLELSDGWTPSYNNPDNHNCDPESEPYCPKCQPELQYASSPLI